MNAPISAFALHIDGNWHSQAPTGARDAKNFQELDAISKRMANSPTSVLIQYITHRSYNLKARLDLEERAGMDLGRV